MICLQKACHAFTHFIEICAHLVPRFLKIKLSRNVPKNDRERDKHDGDEDLTRFWAIRISLGAGSKYVRPKTLISRIYLHRDSYSN